MKWFKKLFAIVKNYDDDFDYLKNTLLGIVEENRKFTKEHCLYSADVHFMPDQDYIICIGRFRNNDYVRCYPVNNQNLHDTITHLNDLEKLYGKGRIDRPPNMNYVASF